jgi:hypothetical protein
MVQQLGHPEDVTVIALDLKPLLGGVSSVDSRDTFARLLGGAVAHACVVQAVARPDGELAYTAVVPVTGQTLTLMRRLLNVQEDFKRAHPDTFARFVVHHGLVFAAQGEGGKSYVGSAMRSAQSHLLRMPGNLDCAATSDFVSATATWKTCSIQFQPLSDAPEIKDLLTFSLVSDDVSETQNAKDARKSMAKDPALRRFLVEHLAAYLGPFAEVLVDSAQRSSTSRTNLIEELSREIDDIPTRERFKAEAMDYLRVGH